MTIFRKLQYDYLYYFITGVSCSLPLRVTPPVELRGPPPGLSTLGSHPCSLSSSCLSLSISITSFSGASSEQLLRDIGGSTGEVRVKLPRVGDRGHVQVGVASQHHAGGGARGVASSSWNAADNVADDGAHDHYEDVDAHDDHENDEHVPNVGAEVGEQRVGLHGLLDVEGDGRDLLPVHVREWASQLTNKAQGAALIAEAGTPGRQTSSANNPEDSEINYLILTVINTDILPIYVMASCSLSVLFVH